MPINQTSTTDPANLLRNAFDRGFLSTLDKVTIARDCCKQKVLPANTGNTIEFHRINNFPKQIAGITQFFGIAGIPSVTGASASSLKDEQYVVDVVTASIELIGNDMELTEQLLMTSEPNPVPELSARFLYNGAQSLDQRYINMMVSGAQSNGAATGSTTPSVEYNGTGTAVTTVWGDGSATLTEATLDADIPSHRIAAETFNTVEANLQANAVPHAPKTPGRYGVLLSPQIAGDLRLDGTFQDISLKGQTKGEAKFESATIGDVFGCQIMVSQNVSTGAAGTVDSTNDDIHRMPAFGMDYCAAISHAKGVGRPRVKFRAPSSDSGDIYGVLGYLVWKAYMAATVLNPLAGNVIKVATTRAAATASGDDATWE